MYSIRFNNNRVFEIKRKNINQNSIYFALKQNLYLIVYSFNDVTEAIKYEAVLKDTSNDSNLPKYMSFELLPDGSFSSTENNFSDFDYTLYDTQAFYAYIVERDVYLNKQNPEKLKSIYAPIYSKIEKNLSLSQEDITNRYNARIEFQDMINNLLSTTSFDNKKQNGDIRLELNINIRTSPWSLSLRIGKNKMYVIRSIAEFIDNVAKESFVSYGKDLEFKHSLSAFNTSAQNLIPVLSRLFVLNNYNEKYMDLYPSSAIKIFEVLKDQIVIIDDENYYINPETFTGQISVGGDGKVAYSPALQGTYISDGKLGAIIDIKNQEIDLIDFENELIQKVYSYFVTKKDFNFDAVEDIFVNKLFPIIENKVIVDDTFKQNHKVVTIDINLFIDLNDNDELILATKYLLGNTPKSKGELLQDIVYRNKIKAFELALKELHIEENEIIKEQERVLNFLKSDLTPLKETCNLMLSESLKKKKITKVGKIRINAKFDINWLDLSLESNDYSIKEINDILSAYRSKKKFYRFRDNIILLDKEELEPLASIKEEFNLDEELSSQASIPVYDAFKLASYGNSLSLNMDNRIRDIIDDIRNFKEADFEPHKQFKNVLRSYQLDAFKWMMTLKKHSLSGILGDDMGLGKTLEMISFISSIDDKAPVLIISPKSLIYNWENEFIKWDSSQKTIVIHGLKEDRKNIINNIDNKKKIIYITSYDAIRNDIEYYQDKCFSFLVLDEAQYIKNAYAQKTKAVKEIKANSRFVLTGTPIENSLTDLWSIFDFLMPNYLLSFDKFKQEYETLIVSDQDSYTRQRLISKITPFILRRTKQDVLKDLPPKFEQVYTLDMKDNQRTLYDVYLEKAKKAMHDKNQSKIDTLALLTRLRQICVDPSMFIENFEDISEKLQATVDLIKEGIANDHKIIVFSSFTKSLEHLIELLSDENIPTYYIYGAVEAKKRLEIANDFNNLNNVKVVLISLKAGGTGLNLTGADIVIHLDPWWNVAAENQATDRAHRIGQQRSVNVIKMVCKNSIEEKVIKLQELKKDLSSSIIHSGDEAIASLNEDDIQYLLS